MRKNRFSTLLILPGLAASFTLFLLLNFGFILKENKGGSRSPQQQAGSLRITERFPAAPTQIPRDEVMPGSVIVQFNAPIGLAKSSATTGVASFDALASRYGAYSIEPIFPHEALRRMKGTEKLLRTYIIRYAADTHPLDVCRDIASDPNIEIAEPSPKIRRHERPNDVLFSQQQDYINAVSLVPAWDVIKGEAGNVTIAIVDGGTDWQHEDMRDILWVNEGEIPGNGIDDDNNGFIDDVHGWNFANNTNNPRGRSTQQLNYDHGTAVAGIPLAMANNSIGIAGASWNSKLMAINVASSDALNDSTLGFSTYLGILYAASNGADIINASWGGSFSLNVAREIVEVARQNGALVISSAGNDGTNNDLRPQYPANYDGVLSVGSLSIGDRRSNFSNYGITVDVFAPGEFLYSTQPENKYDRRFSNGFGIAGTSFSSPLVAGIAALVKTQHPDWTPDQVREQVRVTAVNIDASNAALRGLLGKGRADALRAVTIDNLPAIRFIESSLDGLGENGRVDPGEVIDLTVTLINYLADASNVSVSLTTSDNNIIMRSANVNIASIGSGERAEAIFQFEVRNQPAEGNIVPFIIDVIAGDYSDRDVFNVLTSPPQRFDHNTGVLTTTVTNQGNIGYVTTQQDADGVGFVLNGFDYIFEGGLLIGTGSTSVSDCIRGADQTQQDDDFRPASGSFLRTLVPGPDADQETIIELVDSLAVNPIGVVIAQQSYAYTNEPFNKFIIFKYTIQNTSGRDIQNLYISQFFDWDITNRDTNLQGANDYARFDRFRSLGYIQNAPGNPTRLAGNVVLSSLGATGYRSIHNPNEIYDGFPNAEKWAFMSGGIQSENVDNTDVSTITSTGPFRLARNEAVEVAFAVIAAETLEELRNSADAARYLWENNLSSEIVPRKPILRTAVLQNPAASKYADVVVVSDIQLQSPPAVSVSTNAGSATIQTERLIGSAKTFKGAVEFTGSGTHTIRTEAATVFTGADTTVTRTFEVALAKPGQTTQLSLNRQQATLLIGAGAISSETYFIGETERRDGDVIYRFGPSKSYAAPLELALRYDPVRFAEPSKLFIYRKQDDKWIALASRVDPAGNIVRASTTELGEFKLVYDGDFEGDNIVPATFALQQNYPNPFNPSTTIAYDIPEASQVELVVFNALGQVVRTLVQGFQAPGRYTVVWPSDNDAGELVPSGVYFYQLRAGAFSRTNKMILLR